MTGYNILLSPKKSLDLTLLQVICAGQIDRALAAVTV